MPRVRLPEIREARRWKRERILDVPAKEADRLVAEEGAEFVDGPDPKKSGAGANKGS